MAELSSMGVGVTLYFDLLRKLMCVFILMAILSLPTMLIAASGSSVADDERDVLFSVYLTLANLAGSDDGNATTATGPWTSCNAGSSNCTSQKLDLIGGVAAVDALEASYTITACDLLTVLTFSAFLLYFRRLLSVRRRQVALGNGGDRAGIVLRLRALTPRSPNPSACGGAD